MSSTPLSIDPTASGESRRHTLMSNVADICEDLAAACEQEEQDRRLTKTSMQLLYDAGVLSMKLPACLGGSEADLVTQFEVLECLAQYNPSASWCSMVGATSLAMPGAFLPEEGVAEMFANGSIPTGAIVIAPTGVAAPVDGGFIVSGQWSFASGIHHAEWITAICRMEPRSENKREVMMPDVVMVVFPATEIEIHDNWQVAGLRGTGSCDFSVDQLMVPTHRSWHLDSEPRRGGALYRLGIPAFVANEHAGFALGIARRALNHLKTTAVEKARGYGPEASKLASRQTVQRVIGRNEMVLDAARALAIDLNSQAMAQIATADALPKEFQSKLRAIATYCTEVATEITMECFRYVGASAAFNQSVMQRCLRDINVAAQHLMVSDTSYENLAKIQLGFEGVDPMA